MLSTGASASVMSLKPTFPTVVPGAASTALIEPWVNGTLSADLFPENLVWTVRLDLEFQDGNGARGRILHQLMA